MGVILATSDPAVTLAEILATSQDRVVGWGMGSMLKACGMCGALTADIEVHADWHIRYSAWVGAVAITAADG